MHAYASKFAGIGHARHKQSAVGLMARLVMCVKGTTQSGLPLSWCLPCRIFLLAADNFDVGDLHLNCFFPFSVRGLQLAQSSRGIHMAAAGCSARKAASICSTCTCSQLAVSEIWGSTCVVAWDTALLARSRGMLFRRGFWAGATGFSSASAPGACERGPGVSRQRGSLFVLL